MSWLCPTLNRIHPHWESQCHVMWQFQLKHRRDDQNLNRNQQRDSWIKASVLIGQKRLSYYFTSGTQNQTTRYYSQQTKKKSMLKFLWPLMILHSRILGIIWRGTEHTLFKITLIFNILPGDTRRATSKLPDASDPFLAPNSKLAHTKCFIFLTFYSLIWFLDSFK